MENELEKALKILCSSIPNAQTAYLAISFVDKINIIYAIGYSDGREDEELDRLEEIKGD